MIVTQINGREVHYENIRNMQDSILDTIISEKWIAFVVANKDDMSLAYDIIKKCVKNNVAYVCCAGEAYASLESAFDSEIIKIEGDSNDGHICTVSDIDFYEALFFALYAANIDDVQSKKVICLDLTKAGVYVEIIHSIDKMRKEFNS